MKKLLISLLICLSACSDSGSDDDGRNPLSADADDGLLSITPTDFEKADVTDEIRDLDLHSPSAFLFHGSQKNLMGDGTPQVDAPNNIASYIAVFKERLRPSLSIVNRQLSVGMGVIDNASSQSVSKKIADAMRLSADGETVRMYGAIDLDNDILSIPSSTTSQVSVSGNAVFDFYARCPGANYGQFSNKLATDAEVKALDDNTTCNPKDGSVIEERHRIAFNANFSSKRSGESTQGNVRTLELISGRDAGASCSIEVVASKFKVKDCVQRKREKTVTQSNAPDVPLVDATTRGIAVDVDFRDATVAGNGLFTNAQAGFKVNNWSGDIMLSGTKSPRYTLTRDAKGKTTGETMSGYINSSTTSSSDRSNNTTSSTSSYYVYRRSPLGVRTTTSFSSGCATYGRDYLVKVTSASLSKYAICLAAGGYHTFADVPSPPTSGVSYYVGWLRYQKSSNIERYIGISIAKSSDKLTGTVKTDGSNEDFASKGFEFDVAFDGERDVELIPKSGTASDRLLGSGIVISEDLSTARVKLGILRKEESLQLLRLQ